MERTTVIYFLIITAAAFFLRFFRLGHWSLWVDEWYSINHAQDGINRGLKAINSAHPVYYLLLIPIFKKFGVSEFTARSVSAGVGSLSVPVLILALRPLVGDQTALLFGLLLTISPWHIYLSQNARFYTLTFLFQVLALYNLYQLLWSGSWIFAVLYLLFIGLAIASHETSLQSLVVSFFFLIGVYTIPNLPATVFSIGQAVLLMGFTCVFTVAVSFVLGGGVKKRTAAVQSMVKIHYSKRKAKPVWLLAGSVRKIGLSVVFLAIGYLAINFSHFDQLMLLSSILSFVPLIVVAGVSLFAYSTTRYAFLALSGFLLLTAQFTVWSAILHPYLPFILIILLLASSVDDLILYYFRENGYRERWREAFAVCASQIKQNDVVITQYPGLAEYYLKLPAQWLDSFSPDALEKLKPQRIWIVINESFRFLPDHLKRWVESNAKVVYHDHTRYQFKTMEVSVLVCSQPVEGQVSAGEVLQAP